MSRKRLLFITPVVPSTKGRGRNHRAFQWVNYLSQTYDVTVFCTSVYGEFQFADEEHLHLLDCTILEWCHKHSLAKRFKNMFLFRPSIWNEKGESVRDELDRLQIPKPDIILAFRIQNAPVALKARNYWNVEELWLDIDELDSQTKLSIARLKVTAGYYREAAKSWLDSFLFSLGESKTINRFDKIITSTRNEKERIEQIYRLKTVEVFENMLPARYTKLAGLLQETPFRFLFVGDSKYFPNLDAIDRILFEIIPELRKITDKPFLLEIVGGKAAKKQSREIEKNEYVNYYEDVEDLTSVYRRTNAVIIPLRAGGGSSLKFLEAMLNYKPVISTPIGARGFNVTNGEHVLIGTDIQEIATHCKSLIETPELARKLSENGHRWFIENNSYDITKKKKKEAVNL